MAAPEQMPYRLPRLAQAQTGLMSVVVTQIESDSTMWRRVVETAGRSEAGCDKDSSPACLAVPVPCRPVLAPLYHLRLGERM
jgi:hypothetical protein